MSNKTFPDSFFKQQKNQNSQFVYDAELIEVDCLKSYKPNMVAAALNWKATDIAKIAQEQHASILAKVKAILKKSGTYRDTGEPINWNDYLYEASNGHVQSRQYFIKSQNRFSTAQLVDLLAKIDAELVLQN